MTPRPRPARPMRHYIGRALALNLGWALAALIGLMLASNATQPAPAPAPAPGSPDSLVERMGDACWTGPAPADVELPGHVIFSQPNQPTRLGGPRAVDRALEQLFEGIDHGLRVHAFCR